MAEQTAMRDGVLIRGSPNKGVIWTVRVSPVLILRGSPALIRGAPVLIRGPPGRQTFLRQMAEQTAMRLSIKGVTWTNKGVTWTNKGVTWMNKEVKWTNKGVTWTNKGVTLTNKGVTWAAGVPAADGIADRHARMAVRSLQVLEGP